MTNANDAIDAEVTIQEMSLYKSVLVK